MIVIPRGLARAFRAVARKCSAGRPKGPAPPVILAVADGRLTLTTFCTDVVLVCDVPAPDDTAVTVIIPAAVLDGVDATAGALEVTATGTTGVARWADRGGPREVVFDAEPPSRRDRPPDGPDRWGRVPPRFLEALHACGRCAGRQPTARFALTRVQVRGAAGRVVGSDGTQALIWGGFRLPFPDDLLVPALPVFGAKEVAAAGEVQVGRTATHLIVRAGPWTVFLPVDATARFPDVAGVVPRAAGAAVLDLADADADRLLAEVPGLPGAGDENAPVTLAVGERGEVRARSDGGEAAVLPLARSTASGPAREVAVDRAYLLRALALGFRRVRVVGPAKPVVWADADRTYLAMPLTTDLVVPSADEVRPGPLPGPANERRIAVLSKSPDPPGDPAGSDPPDLLAEAEALKAALAEAGSRAGRLVQALKQDRKKTKALSTAWTALQALNLGAGGDR